MMRRRRAWSSPSPAELQETRLPHSITLITTIAAAFGLALLFGVIAVRLKLPALVGYLLAGIAIGPFTPGFVADAELSGQLAEIGVMLLMFGVGLHFSLDDLLAVRRIALPGAVVQITAATLMGVAVSWFWGWSLGAGLVFGLALSVASTVVLLKALEARGALDTPNGRIAVGWLVVEDLVMVLVLVLLPPLARWFDTDASVAADDPNLLHTLGVTLGRIALFVVLMLVVGRRLFPWLLWQVARTGSRELFTLCVIAAAVGIAFGSAQLFGVSFALGAFFAGMVLRESELSHRAADESLPLRDAFAVLFFVSVGMLFDPRMLIEEPLRVMIVVAIIVLGKSLAAFIIVVASRYPLNTALVVSASLAQIGEFSFILAALGVSLKVLPPEAQSLILAGALISIALNPFVFRCIEPLQQSILKRSRLARRMAHTDDPLAELPYDVDQGRLTAHVVLVGLGRVGRQAHARLRAQGQSVVVAEQDRDRVETLREANEPAVLGDASDPVVLVQAHVARAAVLIVTVRDTFKARQMIETARALNPAIRTIVRVDNDEEASLLRGEHADAVFIAEEELGVAMANAALERAAGSGTPVP
jgi:CPA2 family monovalent cation:H+ antiporter-2